MTGRQFKDISVLAGTAGFGPTTSEPKSEVLPFTLHPYIMALTQFPRIIWLTSAYMGIEPNSLLARPR